MAVLLRFYQRSFDTRPYTTLICANSCLNALGDSAAQTAQIALSKQRPHSKQKSHISYDLTRTLRFGVFGAAMDQGPVIGKWAKFLEYRFPLRSLERRASLFAVGKRVLSDQALMAPLGLVAFIGTMGIMERRTGAEIKQKYTEIYVSALLTNWMVWPVAQVVNFRFIPLAFRVPFQSGCGVFWTLYLSLLNSKENNALSKIT